MDIVRLCVYCLLVADCCLLICVYLLLFILDDLCFIKSGAIRGFAFGGSRRSITKGQRGKETERDEQSEERDGVGRVDIRNLAVEHGAEDCWAPKPGESRE